ncbi:MAG TPA: hypothetical protein ENN31_00675 [Candidatus Vogelbacteria bacterium]|nr:hypothetical protein [Candidatus Vogelbacteria bacterium]
MNNKAILLVFFVLMFTMFYFWLKTEPEKRADFFSPPRPSSISVITEGGSKEDKKESDKQKERVEEIYQDPTISPWEGLFTIRRGNAGKTIQPREEYIILEYSKRAKEPVNISGWILENNPLRGGKRVVIPQGILYLFTNKDWRLRRDIVLEPGEKAIVLSGRMPSLRPVDIDVSFKSNICLGYLDVLPNYRFQPSIRRSCPRPIDFPGVGSLDDDCYAFVRRLARCRTPEIVTYGDRAGEIDGVSGLSRSCREFVEENYNYESCVRKHFLQDDFHQPEWRIFLYQTWSLWADNREVITLYDSKGRKVNQLSY